QRGLLGDVVHQPVVRLGAAGAAQHPVDLVGRQLPRLRDEQGEQLPGDVVGPPQVAGEVARHADLLGERSHLRQVDAVRIAVTLVHGAQLRVLERCQFGQGFVSGHRRHDPRVYRGSPGVSVAAVARYDAHERCHHAAEGTKMSDQIFLYIALAIYFAAMLLIGYLAFRRTDDHEDYMLGGRNLPPWVAALSAGASDMSGWLVMGLPGAIFLTGLIEAWIAVGLTIGAYLNWLLVAPRLRAYTQV